MNAPLDLSLWIQRLKDQATVLKDVGGAAQLSAARTSLRVTPVAFVVPADDSPAGGPGVPEPVIHQFVHTTVKVVLAVKNVSDPTGQAALDELHPIRVAVWDALIGWKPPGAELVVQYGGGRALLFGDATLWWEEAFKTRYRVTAK